MKVGKFDNCNQYFGLTKQLSHCIILLSKPSDKRGLYLAIPLNQSTFLIHHHYQSKKIAYTRTQHHANRSENMGRTHLPRHIHTAAAIHGKTHKLLIKY